MGKFPDKRKVYYESDLDNASGEDLEKMWQDVGWSTEYFCNICDEWQPYLCLENCGCETSGVRYRYYKEKEKSS